MPNANVNKVVLSDGTVPVDLTDTTATESDVASGAVFYKASGARAVGTASGGGGVIPFGRCDSTSTSTAFTATVEGVTALEDGVSIWLENGVVTSAAGFTIDVNDLGAKPVYSNLAAATADTTIFNVNYTMLFVYDEERVSGGCWVCYRGYDSNTNTIGYQLRTNSGTRPASDTGYRYRIWLTSADGQQWVPINTSTSTNSTTARSLNSRAIDPFGPIAYNSTNGTTNSGANLPTGTMWQQYTLTIGYSYVKTLTAYDPVYLKCTPQANGSAVMADIVQALPSSKDGKIYILLGIAYSTTAMELTAEHPVYWHDGTGIRLWTGAEPSGGSTVSVTRSLTSGTKTATLTIDGTGTDLYAPTPPTASSTAPSMDGTASYGSSTAYARADHVHPTDTSRQPTLVSGTNIKTINGNSLLGSGDLVISGGGGASYSTTTATLPTSGWSNNSITVNVIGVTASNDVIVAPAPASAAAWAAAGIVCTAQGAGTLTFTRTAANTAALTANVMIFEGGVAS